MKIIMLSGPSDSGKTSTLNLVYNALLSNGGVSLSKHKLGGDPNDFYDIVTYQGQRIAFYTMGDYARCLIDAMKNYSTSADVLICACNNHFVLPYKSIRHYPHQIVQKTVANSKSLHNSVNQSDANLIISLI
ncbi:hypothetical protein [Paludibacter sp.]|uniref:hypothetical protein n=1 Tax=Paludibacter sp. TaxID=1898105 RepID=UPI001353FBB8|nr:hypothetical protein [Paludibacter sp.]MTK53450.1 hypothetical protein [Paludibacter sp.]